MNSGSFKWMQVYFDKVTEWDIQKGQAVTKIQMFFGYYDDS